MNIGIGFVVSFLGSILGAWAVWQRRNAWGWWETPITLNVILLAVGAVFAVPIFFFRNEVWWWGESYTISAILTFIALANFGAALRRRISSYQSRKWTHRVLVIPTALGMFFVLLCYVMSGALKDSWVLAAPVDSTHNLWVRGFWMSIAISMTYHIAIIARQLLTLRKDRRRTDKKAISLYLASCACGIILCFVAVLAAHGYGNNMASILITATLTAFMFAGQAGTSAWSWRRKTKLGTHLSHHQCKEFVPSSVRPSDRCACQHGGTHPR